MSDRVISVPYVRHLTSTQVHEEIVTIRLSAGGVELSDAAAVTIASWWQSPDGTGRHFAALVSGSPVRVDDLLDAIHDAWQEAGRQPTVMVAPTRRELDLLTSWVHSKEVTS